jgi:predicted Rossmann fold nucleotide-binding protein DprA/Smf involved in DNA uptake
MLERRQGGERTHRTLRAIGRYSETPPEQVLDFTANAFQLLGPADQFTRETAKVRILAALDDQPREVPAITEAADTSPKVTLALLKLLVEEGQVVREGRGVKGSPHTFRRARRDSILSQPHPYREELDSKTGGGGNAS